MEEDFIDDLETLDSKMSESEGSFSIEFEDGYNLKNLIEYLKNTNSEANFIITKDFLTYNQSNSDNTILNNIVFKSKDFSNFEFESKSDKIVVGMSLADLRNVTTSIGKYDKIIFNKKSDEDRIYFKIDGTDNKKKSNLHNNNSILPKQVKFEKCSISDLTENRKPNQNVSSSDFSKMCTTMGKSKCNYITVQGYPNGIKFEAVTDDGIIGKSAIFGQLPSAVSSSKIAEVNGEKVVKVEDNNIYPKIKIDIEIIKKLAKLNNVSKQNKLRLYVGNNLFAIICNNAGGSGELTINIKSIDD